MHSSRMRTVRNSSRLLGGTWSRGVYLPGGCTWSQGVYLVLGCTCSGGYLPRYSPLPVGRQTGVKT